jgi:hypothetical protein
MTSPEPPPIPPPLIEQPPLLPANRPAVVAWYRAWCALLMIAYLGIGLYELMIHQGKVDPDLGLITEALVRNDKEARDKMVASEREDALGGAFVAVCGAIYYLVGILVPRRRWGHTYAMVAIILSVFPFILTVTGMIPLLLAWRKPEVKRWFAG